MPPFFLGGKGDDYGYGIGVDKSGNAFVTGYTTSRDFPARNDPQQSPAGEFDVFVTKFGSLSTPDPACPTEMIYGAYSEEAGTLRSFRDKVLKKTTAGQELIQSYYELSPFIVVSLKHDEQFRKELKHILDSMLPLIRDSLK